MYRNTDLNLKKKVDQYMSNYISKVTASLQTINCKSECLNLRTEWEE